MLSPDLIKVITIYMHHPKFIIGRLWKAHRHIIVIICLWEGLFKNALASNWPELLVCMLTSGQYQNSQFIITFRPSKTNKASKTLGQKLSYQFSDNYSLTKTVHKTVVKYFTLSIHSSMDE